MRRNISALFFLALSWHSLGAAGFAQTSILNPLVTPGTITFFANDPDSPSVPGNVPATITFSTTGGANNKTWRLRIRDAGAGTFGSCPSAVPISRVQVACVSATADGGGTGTCSPPVTLSTTFQEIASGKEGAGTANYTATLIFTFLDSWGFIAAPPAAPCTTNLEYRILAP